MIKIEVEKTQRQLALDAHWSAVKTWRRASKQAEAAEQNLAELIAAERVAFQAMVEAAQAVAE